MTTIEPAPARLAEVISPKWLTRALDGLDNGKRVVRAQVVNEFTTVASKIRFEAVVEDSEGRQETRSYCVKGDFREEPILDFTVEGRFYRELGPALGVRMPRCVYAGPDERGGHSLFIMDDLAAEGVTFLNSKVVYSPDMSAAALKQLALLHARTWGEANLVGLDWLAANQLPVGDMVPAEVLHGRINDGRAAGLPEYLRDGERIKAAMQRVTSPQRVCVVHGDPHSLNIYLDREGRPGLLDWQTVHVGHWATDVSYHIGAVLDIESRRQNERALLRGYLDELARLGQEPPEWEDAWDSYASHFAYGYFMWSFAQMTPRVDILEHIPRLGTAIHDHDTFARLGV